MAHSGKTITFATDLLPQEDNIYNLGIDGQKWKIRGDVTSDKVTTFKLATPLTNGSRTAQVETSPYQGTLWKFNASLPVSSLATGDTIIIKTPGAGGSYGVFLSLDNGITYRPISISGASRLTTHFSSGVMLILTYNASGTVNTMRGKVDANGTLYTTTGDNNVSGGRWEIMNLYDSGNSNDTGTLIRDYGGNVAIVTTTAALYRYQLMLSITDTNYGWKAVPINTTSNTQGTGKTTIYTGEFNPFGEIYYYSHTDTVNANTTVRADRIWKTYPVNIKYSFNCGDTLTASKDVYIVATMQSATTAKLRNPTATGDNAKATATGANAGPITQTLPTTNDGFIYIRLGRAYNSNTVDISIDHPIYYHDGTSIRRLSPINTIGTTKGDMMYWSAANIPKRLAIGTAGYFLKSTTDGPAWEQKLPIANGGTGATTAAGARTNLEITAANVVGTGTTAQFYRGDNSWSNTLVGPLYVNNTTDATGAGDAGALIIGTKTGENVAIDNNEIMARNNKATSTLYINNDGGLVSVGSGGLTTSGNLSATGTLSITSTSTLTGNTTIGNSSTASTLNVYGATTLHSTLSVTSTSKLTEKVGIGTDPDNATTGDIHILTIKGNTRILNSSSTVVAHIDTNTTSGSLITIHPHTPNTGSLGTSSYRWAKLYIGTSNSYGDVYTPIYWNNGVPATVTPTQRLDFEFNTTYTSSLSFTSSAITLNTEVSQIVVTSGVSYLNSEITWTIAANSNNVPTLTLSATTNIPLNPENQKIEGYIILAHTADITSVTTIVSNT